MYLVPRSWFLNTVLQQKEFWLLGKMVDTRAGQEKFKISVKHSVILKGKVRGEKCRDGVIAKEQISLAERVPSDPCWNNLNKVNIIIGLYTPTRYMNLYLHK